MGRAIKSRRLPGKRAPALMLSLFGAERGVMGCDGRARGAVPGQAREDIPRHLDNVLLRRHSAEVLVSSKVCFSVQEMMHGEQKMSAPRIEG